MSTKCELHFVSTSQALANSIASQVLKEVKRLEIKYNYYNPNSYLSQINKRTINQLDIETKDILKDCLNYYAKTNHIFNIAIATIKDLYTLATLSEFYTQRDKLIPYSGCEHIKIQKNRVIFDNPYTKIDFGGYVKEYAVDQSIKVLKKNNINSAFVNYGGDMYIMGLKPNGSKYKVGIKNPNNPQEILLSVELKDQALTTSGGYERSYTIEDKSFSHIIAQKAQSNYLSATVISNSSVDSGVYSTSLMIDNNINTNNKIILIDKNLKISQKGTI